MQAIRILFLPVALLLTGSAAQATTLNVVAGQLVGASNVNVGGQLYDVTFEDGTCIALFDGCDDVSDFTFQTLAGARAASQALLDQVLLDGTLGSFDSEPQLTAGCTSTSECKINTPYDTNTSFNVYSIARNLPGSATDAVTDGGANVALDLSLRADMVYADWTLVPEPATGLLVGAGLVLMSARRRRAVPR